MSKFATKTKTKAISPVTTVSQSTPDTVTHERGAGFSRNPKSELFLLAVTNLVGEDTFYETGKQRDTRFRELIRKVWLDDPGWIARFVPYLRNDLFLRSAPVVMALEGAKIGLETSSGDVNLRDMVNSSMRRADEPAEALAYWLGTYGKQIPMPVKRGIGDAALRLYNERSALKYDSAGAAVRMGDVLELTHPATSPARPLFRYLIDRRHNRDDIKLDELPMLRARRDLDKLSAEDFREAFSGEEGTTGDDLVRAAGITWEYASSKYGKLDAAFWERMIPEMGYMALLRNLRNFDDVGVDGLKRAYVAGKIADPEEVAKSMQLPLRFYNAYREAKGFHWAQPLETALNLSLANVPEFPGRSLVLVDTSSSMFSSFSLRGTASRHELAGIFGAVIATRGEKVDLVQFGTTSEVLPFRKGDPILRIVDQLHNLSGTNTWQALERHYDGHDRVVIVTDEQAHFGYGYTKVPDVPIYTFNVAGYKAGHSPSGEGKSHTFGGLSDAGFKMIPLIEQAGTGQWPF